MQHGIVPWMAVAEVVLGEDVDGEASGSIHHGATQKEHPPGILFEAGMCV